MPFASVGSHRQSITEKDTTIIQNQFLAYPVVFYLPETRWGFGGAGLYNFRFKNEPAESNPSQIQFVTSFTQNKQLILLFPFEFYKKNNHWKLKGELSYFKYQFNYYGIGINSRLEDKEVYKASFPRVKIDILRRYQKLFIGIKMGYDNISINQIVEKGKLEFDNPIGIKGGKNIGLGLILHYDQRNYLFNPTKGHYIEAESFASQSYLGSDFDFIKLVFNASKYIKIANEHTLAANFSTSNIIGDVSFYEMVFFGTPKQMRGYQDRRFMDKNTLFLQAEYRFPIYSLIQGVTFISTGTVGSQYSNLFSNQYKWSYGAGLRFLLNKKDRVRLRIDYGLTPNEGGAFYFTVNDAF